MTLLVVICWDIYFLLKQHAHNNSIIMQASVSKGEVLHLLYSNP